MEAQRDVIHLEAGTPVIVVGFHSAEGLATPGGTWPEWEPSIVFAGRLAEPYREGRSLLLSDGTLAGSVAAKGIVDVTFVRDADGRGARLLILRRNSFDRRDAMLYMVLEDTTCIVRGIELCCFPLVWPLHVSYADRIRREFRRAHDIFCGNVPHPRAAEPPNPAFE